MDVQIPSNSISSPRRILAVRLDNIGDVVMLGPSLRALKTAYPDSRLTLMCSPAGSQVAPMLPWVDDVMVLRAVWQDASWAMPLDPERELDLVATLRERQFDAAFIFTSFSQSPYPPAYVCYLAGIPARVGQSKELAASSPGGCGPSPTRPTRGDRSLHLLEEAGIPLTGTYLELRVPESARNVAGRILAEGGIEQDSRFVIMAPGDLARPAATTLYATRRWPAYSSDRPICLSSLWGASAKQSWSNLILDAAGERAVSLVGRTAIPQLVAIIRRAALLIANDFGAYAHRRRVPHADGDYVLGHRV